MILNVGELISERYEINKKIGSGGMAIVYKALDTKLNRQVTLKVMREEFAHDEDFIRRFQKEAHAAASISHQNIVNIYDVGSEGYLHYIVMEYIDGYTLKDLIRKKAPFTNEETLGVAIQIAAALEHAHNNKIVHRDIKPQNILITSDGTVKVTDFGIARVTSDATQTATSKAMGSVHYFSPEQARGGYTDHGSDIYSLGIVMYEMTTGKIPFDADTPVAIALKHINDELPDIKNLNPITSESIIRIIARSTQKATVKRYRSMESMGNDLKRALTNSTGDFVAPPEYEEEPEIAKSHTISLSDDEVAQLKREAKSIFFNNGEEEFEPDDDYEDDEDEGLYDNEYGNDYGSDYDNPENKYDEQDKDEYDTQKLSHDESANDSGDADYDKSSERKIIIAAVITSVIIIAVSCYLLYSAVIKRGAAEDPVRIEVPNVVGEHVDVVREKYKDAGFGFTIDAWLDDEDTARGIIIEQVTPAGSQIYENMNVHVVVSRGADLIEIPNFIGMTLNELEELYENEDTKPPFETKTEETYDETAAIGDIVRQEPEAGTLAKPGDSIIVYVCIGQEIIEVEVPSLLGMTEDEAKATLTDAGLEPGSITRASSNTVDEGKVISQSPEHGRKLVQGRPVTFTVSTGPAPIQPDTPPPAQLPANNPQESTRFLVFSVSNLPVGMETVEYRVIKFENGTPSVVEHAEVPVSSFPITIEVTGTGQMEYQFYYMTDGRWEIQEITKVDFDA